MSSIDSLLGVTSTLWGSERGGTWEMEKGRSVLEGSTATTSLGHTEITEEQGNEISASQLI